ncbi:ShlB/FhaC/HecB family hemolysin secretion/activation protein [Allosphingosinicella indica]|uniref:Hemolysin activation/secretion protein n=1 Tax=Allosphingosinicella indica TaxID=941907 RepID=A0A1X7GK23_9SPHN|nr:ShlB/FhaC/HecB family hemolysin secretion/activation protein [Allosphingosinicella indica]SMF70831.1 Hemolysin activation/secretion protein [Allosphingosinicella indica]
MKFVRRPKALVLAAAMASVASPLMAQAVPGNLAPTREEVERTEFRPTEAPRTRLTVEGDVERAPCPLAAPDYQNISFTVRDVSFNQLAGVPPELLRPAYAEYVGQTVPIATVCEIRDRAATILRREGYLAAVQVPPQEIENGNVRFDVLMAKIVQVQVRGDAGRSEGRIAGFLDAIKDMPVFNEREAERYLLLARDMPGYDIRMTLRPAGTQPGEVVAEVAVAYTPVEVDFNVQNYGSRDVGRFGGLLRAQFNGLTGLGDRTTIGFFSTADFEEQQVLQLAHEFGIGPDGLRLAGRFTYAWTDPSGNPALDIKSRTLLATAEMSYPFVRSQQGNLIGAAGLDFINQEIDILGTTLNRDKLRVAFVRLDFDATDPGSIGRTGNFSIAAPRWRAGGSLELRQGLDIFDATRFVPGAIIQPSRVPGDSTSTTIRGSAYAEYRVSPEISFWLSPRAQFSGDPLYAFEEFSAGNYTVGRGYDPGTIVGDSGVGLQAEIRGGAIVPQGANSLAFQPYAFFDAARVWNNDDGIPGSESLYSAGAGVRASWGDRARLDLSLAVPLKRAGLQTDRGDARVLLSFTTRLVPWSR